MANTDTHRQLHELFNARDFEGLTAHMADEFSYDDHARNLTMKGSDSFVEWLNGWTGAMSDAKVTEPRYLDAGDTSVALFTGRGTNDGPMGPFEAGGKTMNTAFCEIFTFDADGRATGGEMFYDQLGLLAQLGHIDAPT